MVWQAHVQNFKKDPLNPENDPNRHGVTEVWFVISSSESLLRRPIGDVRFSGRIKGCHEIASGGGFASVIELQLQMVAQVYLYLVPLCTCTAVTATWRREGSTYVRGISEDCEGARNRYGRVCDLEIGKLL